MPTENRVIRIDFLQEIISFDEKEGIVEAYLIPNPDRYERKKIDGEDGYWDKFDRIFFTMKTVMDSLSLDKEIPIYYSPPKIENSDGYILSRIEAIKQMESGTESFKFKDSSEEFLENLKKDKMRFVILSIDLKGSTKMSQELTCRENAEIITLFLREMTLIADKFNGYVLKYLGDGLIAYFPEPNFIGMNDNAIDCAVTMKKMIVYGLNSILETRGLPALDFRIGLDETINLAVKIQSRAKSKEILMGESVVESLYTFWRQRLEMIKDMDGWDYKDKKSGEIYAIYTLLDSDLKSSKEVRLKA
ncbi:adenylate/guanylate cyclase domain-containing protein [Candidatus Micrarchaeota archaeon]|nr:adenylate/guanylate cyclase domain-containing protein [Candidatus Micrarchaeota archaeon]